MRCLKRKNRKKQCTYCRVRDLGSSSSAAERWWANVMFSLRLTASPSYPGTHTQQATWVAVQYIIYVCTIYSCSCKVIRFV
jgi:hypothetical protein